MQKLKIFIFQINNKNKGCVVNYVDHNFYFFKTKYKFLKKYCIFKFYCYNNKNRS